MTDRAQSVLLRIFRLVLVVALSIIVGMLLIRRLLNPSHEPTRTWVDQTHFGSEAFTQRCGPGELRPALTVVTSPEKKKWVQVVADAYMAQCYNTQIRIVRQRDNEALVMIEDGTLSPSLWLPSDSTYADSLEEWWLLEPQRAPLEHQPSLLRTPTVVMLWADRVDALEMLWPQANEARTFMSEIVCPGIAVADGDRPMMARSWSEWARRLGESPVLDQPLPDADLLASWGSIDVQHTLPTRGPTGSMALLAAAYGYLVRLEGVPLDAQAFEDALDRSEGLEQWLRECSSGKLLENRSPHSLARQIYLRGPVGADGVLIQENIAFEFMAADPRLHLVYPRTSYVSNHPVVVFDSEDKTTTLRFSEFLASDAMQLEALRLGLRPAHLDDSLLDLAPRYRDSPLIQAARVGVVFDIDEVIAEPPRIGRDALRTLLDRWSAATADY